MGKIERMKSGTYRTRVYLGKDKDGKDVYKSLTDPDKTQLQKRAAEYKARNREVLDRRSFQVAMVQYIKVKKDVLSPSTIRGYSSIRDELIDQYKEFCQLRLDQITRRTLQRLIVELQEAGKSPKTIRNYNGLISAVLKYHGYYPPIVTLPQRQKPAYYIPDEQTVSTIMQKAKGTRLEIPIVLAMLGLRRGEICALKAEDLDGNIIHIHRNLVYDSDGNVHEKAPKTYTSNRFVQIPDVIADKIRQQGYVTDYQPRALTEAFSYFLHKHGIKHFRLHDCRHFFVSYCHNVLKLSDAQIMRLGGWQTDHVMRAHYMQSMNDHTTASTVAESIGAFMA